MPFQRIADKHWAAEHAASEMKSPRWREGQTASAATPSLDSSFGDLQLERLLQATCVDRIGAIAFQRPRFSIPYVAAAFEDDEILATALRPIFFASLRSSEAQMQFHSKCR